MSIKSASTAVQKWGNSLAIRIPSGMARCMHFHSGMQVSLEVQHGVIVIYPTNEQKLSLKERLALFDPQIHSGEVMAVELIGKEKL